MLTFLRALLLRIFGLGRRSRPNDLQQTIRTNQPLLDEVATPTAEAGGATAPEQAAVLPPYAHSEDEKMPPIQPETPKADRSELLRRMKRIDPQMIRRYRQKSGQ